MGKGKAASKFRCVLAKGHTRNPKSKHQRYQRVFAMPVLSGNAGSTYLKRQRHAARIKEEDAEWMSVLSQNTVFTNLDSIFVTDIEPVGLGGDTRGIRLMCTCPRLEGFLMPAMGRGNMIT